MWTDKQARSDMAFLLNRPEFRRFMLPVIQEARIFQSTTDGSDGRNLAFDEGRRSLGLDILAICERGQPAQHPESLPIFTIMQVFREETQSQPTEKPNEPYDRTADLDEDDPE